MQDRPLTDAQQALVDSAFESLRANEFLPALYAIASDMSTEHTPEVVIRHALNNLVRHNPAVLISEGDDKSAASIHSAVREELDRISAHRLSTKRGEQRILATSGKNSMPHF
jgi:hypothetical protein